MTNWISSSAGERSWSARSRSATGTLATRLSAKWTVLSDVGDCVHRTQLEARMPAAKAGTSFGRACGAHHADLERLTLEGKGHKESQMATDFVAYALFPDREHFDAALEALRAAGFRNSDVSAILRRS